MKFIFNLYNLTKTTVLKDAFKASFFYAN